MSSAGCNANLIFIHKAGIPPSSGPKANLEVLPVCKAMYQLSTDLYLINIRVLAWDESQQAVKCFHVIFEGDFTLKKCLDVQLPIFAQHDHSAGHFLLFRLTFVYIFL